MLHTTFNRAKKAGACIESYKKMAKALGGISKYGKDTPIPLDKIVEVCGLPNAIWTFKCTLESSEYILIEFACQCAEHTLHFYEDKYPDDKRPRKAIQAARRCITDKSPAARDAAWDARDAAGDAWDAAWAAWDAARDAAGAAWDATGDAAGDAWDAEQTWQKQRFLELLRGN